MAQIISISKAKQQLLELARRNEDLGESFILVRDGVPVCALLPFEEYEALLETLDILEQEPDVLAKLHSAEKDIRSGKGKVWKPAIKSKLRIKH